MLHVDTVGTTTSPVTHVAVVAVKRASINGTHSPEAELMGSISKRVPHRIAKRKLSKIKCVVVIENRFFIFISSHP